MNEQIRPFLETAEAYDISAYNRMAALGKSFLSELGNYVAGQGVDKDAYALESSELHVIATPDIEWLIANAAHTGHVSVQVPRVICEKVNFDIEGNELYEILKEVGVCRHPVLFPFPAGTLTLGDRELLFRFMETKWEPYADEVVSVIRKIQGKTVVTGVRRRIKDTTAKIRTRRVVTESVPILTVDEIKLTNLTELSTFLIDCGFTFEQVASIASLIRKQTPEADPQTSFSVEASGWFESNGINLVAGIEVDGVLNKLIQHWSLAVGLSELF